MASTTSEEAALTLGRVDQVRVQVGFSNLLDGPPDDVFLLDLARRDTAEPFDEAPYLAALDPLVTAASGHHPPYSLHLHRHRTSWGVSVGDVEIRLVVMTGHRAGPLPAAVVDAVSAALAGILDQAGRLEAEPVAHGEAVERARGAVEAVYHGAGELAISDEEHQAARGLWSIGLRSPELDRYVAEVGFLQGYAGSTHVRHLHSEVLDSVGSE